LQQTRAARFLIKTIPLPAAAFTQANGLGSLFRLYFDPYSILFNQACDSMLGQPAGIENLAISEA
jgi:hypothetical protein